MMDAAPASKPAMASSSVPFLVKKENGVVG